MNDQPRCVTCPVCGDWKPVQWDMCRSCLAEYGDRDEWPEWLHALIQDERRVRYSLERLVELEMSVPPDVAEDLLNGTYDGPPIEQLRTRERMAWSGERSRTLIPRDPYPDEARNGDYRVSHRIEED